MNASERKTIRQLNNLSEEVFKLYSSGKTQEALIKAKSIVDMAEEKLGPSHPFTNTYYENLEFIKNRYRKGNFGLYDKFNDRLNNSSKILNKNTKISNNYVPKNYSKGSYISNKNLKTAKSAASFNPIKIISIGILGAITVVSLSFFYFIDNFSIPYIQLPSNNSIIKLPISLANDSYQLKEKALIDAPLISQLPELPRGCEVTSLAMLLQYAGVNVDKMELARKIKRDPTPYKVVDNRIHYGNPEYGFVGNMYSFDEPGLGVYHGPIRELMESYLPGQTIDLTGRPFKDLFYFISNDIPVWVIINTKYKELSPDAFEVWYTKTGPIQVTYKQHSVLITGYDEEYVYFNDPLLNIKNNKAPIKEFENAWKQMGLQAVSYIPKGKSLLDILPID
ncbi:hypothetical protein BHF71_01505 [Vulcanibacillus modesticaldus]|uniref:Peptidase C39-like domain-containing protein n=1 Tax=Vulcanibacillus modesticaldus TaxID=337097 RepID=A0A1D2YW61_9BACI|nr:hypothetical protein BHF71_01505 [Vulcanibacillus modesticaldus]